MNALITSLTILFISSLGFIIIWGFRLLPPKNNLLAAAYSYGLGVGLISMQLFIYARLHIPWHKELLIFPWLVLIVVLLIKNRKAIHLRLPKKPKLGIFEYLLLVGIFLTISYVVFEALIRPVSVWDSWAMWLFKAKIFFMDGGVFTSAFHYEKSGYPLVINFLGTFIYLMLGRVDDSAVLLTSSAFYLSLALLFFCSLNKKFSLRYALLFTFLLITTQNFIRQGGRIEAGQADLPLGYYAFASLMLLFNYLKNSDKKSLLLMNIFVGILSLIKYEGIPLGIAIQLFALIHIYKHKLYTHLWYLLFWVTPLIDWQVYRTIYQPQNSYFESHRLILSFNKIVNAIFGTIKEFINLKSWNMLWIIYFYSLFWVKVKYSKELVIANTIIFFQLSIYMTMYFFTVGNGPESSIERLLIHIAPIVLFSLAVRLSKSPLSFNNILLKKEQ